jgi:hypothetical protein
MVFRAMGIYGVTLGMSKFKKTTECCPDVSNFHLGWPQELASLAFHLLTDPGLSMSALFPRMRIVGQPNTVLITKTLISVKLELEYEKTNACSQRVSMCRIILLEREWTLPDLLISGGETE